MKLNILKQVINLLMVVLLVLSTGCATIFSGTKQKVTINSTPENATVYVAKYATNNGSAYSAGNWRFLKNVTPTEIGKTPLTTKVNRTTNLIFVAKEGYCDTLLYSMNPAIIFKSTDPNTGKVKKQTVIPAKYTAKSNGWFYANWLLGGIPGMIIDAATGALLKLDKNMEVTLKEVENGKTSYLDPINNKFNNTLATESIVKEEPKKAESDDSKNSLSVGDKVKFFHFSTNSTYIGTIIEIKSKVVVIEYTSFDKKKIVEKDIYDVTKVTK
jgi:hypothetical protein